MWIFFRGKKKLEKSLQQAKDEIIGLQEKIKEITAGKVVLFMSEFLRNYEHTVVNNNNNFL